MSNPYVMTKYDKLIGRLRTKIEMSATPIEGFMVGLSGTDSILTYLLLDRLAADLKGTPREFQVVGVHYIDTSTISDSFIKYADEYLTEQTGNPCVLGVLEENLDQLRWADLHIRAVNQQRSGPNKHIPKRFWVASTVNATEKALGTYSIMAKSASIEPIASLWKSEVLDICRELGVPEQMLKNSQTPDCACGRDEFAAENIELIDCMLRDTIPSGYTLEQVKLAADYIRNTKKEYGFKARTPYTV